MLPIKRVVLFKHGVGFFERTGAVDGDELIELGFKSDQMNDVLKSLTALDFGGGHFAALSYDSEEPLERRLAEINLHVPDGGAISAFLEQLKGTRVAIPRHPDRLVGVVVGIEEIEHVDGDRVSHEKHLAVLADHSRLVRVPLSEVGEIEFLDESVRRELRTLLDIHATGIRKDRKRLTIQARGEGQREVAVSYVVEAPVWKTSYRIVLRAPNAETKPLLQGWALVDNTTEDDWQGAHLSLVAGLPISFVHDLYSPRYRRRPVVEVQEEEAVAPPIVEAGLLQAGEARLDEEMAAMEPVRRARAKGGRAERAKMMAPPPQAMAPAPAGGPSSVQVHTRTQEVGDLFAYEITQPVDIDRGQSALVPILQAEADLERVALYNHEIRGKNPMTAFRMKNTTGLTLEGGPVTVFEEGGYVGEAMLDTMRKAEERITPYSVELGIHVKRKVEHQRRDFTRVTRQGAYLYKFYEQLLVTTYTFTSQLDRDTKLYLDHRFTYDARRDTEEPVEITDHFWRFRLALGSRGEAIFVVREVSEQYESIAVEWLARETVHQLASDIRIPDAHRQALDRIADQAGIARVRRVEIQKLEQELGRIEDGQERLRDNLQALGRSTEEAALRTKYVASLTRDEDRIETLRTRLTSLRAELEAAEKTLGEMVEALEL